MLVISIVFPILLTARSVDIMRWVFLVFTSALILNLSFVLNQDPMTFENGRKAYIGYFTWKGILGECAAFTFMLALYEILFPGRRRVLGLIAISTAVYIVFQSDSKGALSFAIVAPALAIVVLYLAKKLRISPALVLAPIPIIYTILSVLLGGLASRISWHLYGNYNLTGRTIIWDFVNTEVARRPLLGWGYQSFWLIGPDAPSVVDAPGWVKNMPSAHNGYLDTIVDMGYVGLVFLITFIFTTVHAIGRVADRHPAQGWRLMTIALFLILTNFVETGWMRGIEMLWLMFLIIAADTGRYWQLGGALQPVRRSSSLGARAPSVARAPASRRLGRFEKRYT